MEDSENITVNSEGEIRSFKSTNRRYRAVILGLVITVILLIATTAFTFISRNAIIFKSKAAGGYGVVDVGNSYLFASPLKAKANGVEKIRVSIFVLDTKGSGLLGKSTVLSGDGLTIAPILSKTDELGRTLYDVSSTNKGTHQLSAEIEGENIPQKLTVVFY